MGHAHLVHRLPQHHDRAVHVLLLRRFQRRPVSQITRHDLLPQPVRQVEEFLRAGRQRIPAEGTRLGNALLTQLRNARLAVFVTTRELLEKTKTQKGQLDYRMCPDPRRVTDRTRLTSTGSTGGPKQITHRSSSSAPSTLSFPFARTARASRCRLASSALAATAAMHADLCCLQWARWQFASQ